jgi:hypothetical protein
MDDRIIRIPDLAFRNFEIVWKQGNGFGPREFNRLSLLMVDAVSQDWHGVFIARGKQGCGNQAISDG